jgi:tetratricopeptide (TPR) repeat protein
MNDPSSPTTTPSGPWAAIRIPESESIPPPPDLFWNGLQIAGVSSGPVNTEEPDRDFFTDPRLDQGGNTGRLFYHQFFLRHPHDPQIPERRVWFLCWSPLDDGARAQRLPEKPGYLIAEVTTDGRTIQVQHVALLGEATWVDTFRWAGDSLGRGHFARQENSEEPPTIPEQTAFERERDRGYGLLSTRKWSEAAMAFEKALVLKSEDPAVLFALAVAWEDQAPGNPAAAARAIEIYGRTLMADPQRSPALRRRADLYERQGQLHLAKADLARLIALEPDAWEPLLDRARIEAKSADFGNAIADALEAARRAPTEVSPWESLARYQYRAGQLTEAVATGRRLLALDDSQTAVRVTLACAQVRLGRLEDALKEYREALSNGVSHTERRWGIRELERCLAQLPSASSERSQMQKLLQTLRGPDALEGGEEGAD